MYICYGMYLGMYIYYGMYLGMYIYYGMYLGMYRYYGMYLGMCVSCSSFSKRVYTVVCTFVHLSVCLSMCLLLYINRY